MDLIVRNECQREARCGGSGRHGAEVEARRAATGRTAGVDLLQRHSRHDQHGSGGAGALVGELTVGLGTAVDRAGDDHAPLRTGLDHRRHVADGLARRG